MSERKTEFWWASIHGADPEAVEKTENDGRKCIYTAGCGDPFYLDEQPCPVLLVSRIEDRPLHPEKAKAKREAEQAEYDAMLTARHMGRKTYIWNETRKPVPQWHGWRGPR